MFYFVEICKQEDDRLTEESLTLTEGFVYHTF